MGTFINENLIPGEKIIYKSQVHWMVYYPAVFNLFLALLVVVVGKYQLHITSNILTAAAVILLAIAVGKAIQSFCHRNYTEIAITDQRLIAKFGVVRREMIELPLAKIESVLVEQSAAERMIDAGSISARGTGIGMAPVRYIDHPIKFRNILNEAISHAKQGDQN